MAPTPRKSAHAFTQTWTETDVAFLDPTSLPIAKVPRAWERKQDKKSTVEGRSKTVWRRYSTRSRIAADVAPEEEEEHDSRSRAVKKLQRMSPQAMERASKSRLGKGTFKATRWDRRKSVLPRRPHSVQSRTPANVLSGKNATRANPNDEETEEIDSSFETQNTTDLDVSNASISEIVVESSVRVSTVATETADKRAAFTFSVEDGVINHHESENEATLVDFFRSPTKNASPKKVQQPTEAILYPELPCSPSPDVETEMVDIMDEEKTVAHVEQRAESPPLEEVEASPEEPKAADSAVNISYPSLPQAESVEPEDHFNGDVHEQEDEGMSVRAQDFVSVQDGQENSDQHVEDQEESSDEQQFEMEEQTIEFESTVTEEISGTDDAEMGDDVVEELVAENQDHVSSIPPPTSASMTDDIADGLTLGSSQPSESLAVSRELKEGPEDATEISMDDTAMLKDFLSRTAASKASKAAVISRRESLQNRRDSDVVRHALASPRKILGDKDPNSPSKFDNDATLELTQTLTLSMSQQPLSPSPTSVEEPAKADDASISESAANSSRRSSRPRKSRLPAPASAISTGPSKISVRSADGNEPIILKKSDAQELSLLTRNNTRKNKQGAFSVSLRLLKLSKERFASMISSEDDTLEPVQVPGKKYVRWDEQLAYYQEGTDTMANQLADAESLATPDELSAPAPAVVKKAKVVKQKISSSSPGKTRRVRGLGATNGTPAKGLLTPASLLPDEVQKDKEKGIAQVQPSAQARLPKPKIKTSTKKLSAPSSTTSSLPTPTTTTTLPVLDFKLPTLDIAPIGIESAGQRKSRLATPKRMKLPGSTSTTINEGKENATLAGLPKKGRGILPAPTSSGLGFSVVGGGGDTMSGVGATGLPRRKPKKL